MRLFIRNLIVFGIFSLVLFISIVFIERLILNSQDHFELPKKDRYIFLGHSHAQMAINDSLIDSSLNLASAGEAYFYTFIKLNKILESNQDKKVIFLEYSNNNIVSEMNNWIWDDIHILDRYRLYSSFTPYEEAKLLYSKNPKMALLCDVRSVVNNVYYIFNLKNIASNKKMGGYIYLVRDKTDSLLQAMTINHDKIQTDSNISNTNIKYLVKIIEMCRKNGNQIFLVRIPLHPKYQRLGNESRYRDILNHELGDVDFLDFKDYHLKDSDYGDLEHLNYRGAKKYSLFFNKLLKSGLLEKADKQKYINQQMAIDSGLP
jgi:hypothetical protein